MIKYWFLISVLMLVTGCSVSNEVLSNVKTERITQGTAVFPLINRNFSDTTDLKYEYSYYALCDSVFKDSVNCHIRDFTIGFTQFENNKANNVLSTQFFVAQLDSFNHIYLSEDENDMLWELEGNAKINDEKENFIQVELGGWTYTGGAHGNGYSSTKIIDKSSGRLLNLCDFITDTIVLNEIAEVEFRKLYDLKPDESLNEAGFWFDNDLFQLNENFSFSEGNMVFLYNSYEIAPYSGGPTYLEVPIAKIKHILKDLF